MAGLLAGWIGMGWGGVAWAHRPHHGEPDHERARRLVHAGEILPLDRILERDQRIEGRRILEVKLERDHGEWIYEIEVMDAQGVVMELEFDARTGRFLSEHKE